MNVPECRIVYTSIVAMIVRQQEDMQANEGKGPGMELQPTNLRLTGFGHLQHIFVIQQCDTQAAEARYEN